MDQRILVAIHSFSNPFLDSVFVSITTLANFEYIFAYCIALLVFCIYRQKRFNAVLLVLGVGGAAVLNLLLKALFQRQRPDIWHHLIVETDYSFPSGHAMLSCALILCIIIFLWHTKWKKLAIGLGGLLILLVGLSRLYLGVHYPSDVIAGWLFSFVWIYSIYTILRRSKGRR